MSGFTSDAKKRLVWHSLGIQEYTLVFPMVVELTIDAPSDGSAGTPVTGGSYFPREATMTDNGVVGTKYTGKNLNDVDFEDMPSVSVVGWEIKDSSGVHKRVWHGVFADQPISVAAGTTFRIPAGTLTVELD